MTTHGTALSDPSLAHGTSRPLAPANRSMASQGGLADKLGEEGAKRQAWLREMERAQLAGWFVPGGREASHHEFGVNSSVRLEPQHSPAAFVSERGFPYAEVSESVEPLGMRGDASGSTVSGSASTSVDHQDPSTPVPQRDVIATRDSGEGRPEKGVVSVAQELPEERGNAATLLPTPGFSRGSGHAFAARSAAVQESPSLPVRQSVIPPEQPRLISLPALFRIEFSGSPQVDGKHNLRMAVREAEALDDVFFPRTGTQRSTATRLHTQWTSEGLNLWIGMDGTARQVELQAQAIAATLQRTLKSQGQRLSRVVCNGAVVFDDKLSELASRRLTDFSSFLTQEAHVRMSADISIPISETSKESQ